MRVGGLLCASGIAGRIQVLSGSEYHASDEDERGGDQAVLFYLQQSAGIRAKDRDQEGAGGALLDLGE
jgi:hypothetical protein